MGFNQYGVYSTLSQVESSNNKEYEECIKLLDAFDDISTKEAAKEFLKKTWSYTDYSQKKTIAKDCVIYASEKKGSLVISFDGIKNHRIYIYNK